MQKIRHNPGLGRNIRKLRMENHLTQDQVIAQMQTWNCNISRATYAKIESGIANIRVSELTALSKIFNVDYNRFFEGLDVSDH